MDCWEYLVIHLNVEPPKPAPSGQVSEPESPAPDPGQSRQVFSDSFLKKEFPQFYEARAEPSPQHPAQQLQNFLNGHGQRGWILIGLFPIGVLPMLVFRRPKPQRDEKAGPAAEGTGGSQAPPAEPSLQAVLDRLEALEQRLQAGSAPSAPPPGPRPGQARTADPARGGSRTARTTPPRDAAPAGPAEAAAAGLTRLSARQLKALEGEASLPSSEAAAALGLRSAASLANLGARLGYEPGLCKRGPNGRVAVYVGTGPAVGGGKERRLWVVVEADRIGL